MTRRTGNITLYTDRMNWMPFEVKGSQGYAWSKTLSKDHVTGARTMLIKYEAGFKAPASVSTWPVDIYTLEGSMRAGERRYQKDTYHYRPAGTRVGPVECAETTVRILFTADSLDPSKSSTEEIFVQNVATDVPPDPPTLREEPLPGDARTAGASAKTELAAEMFSHGHVSAAPAGVRVASGKVGDRWRKILRLDPKAEMSIRVQRAFKTGTRDAVDIVHMHPFIEEAFLITGLNQDYDQDIDGHWKWMDGTYVCRQPNEGPHGDATKLDDRYYMIVRCGWTPDEEKAADWLKQQEATEVPIPGPIPFVE